MTAKTIIVRVGLQFGENPPYVVDYSRGFGMAYEMAPEKEATFYKSLEAALKPVIPEGTKPHFTINPSGGESWDKETEERLDELGIKNFGLDHLRFIAVGESKVDKGKLPRNTFGDSYVGYWRKISTCGLVTEVNSAQEAIDTLKGHYKRFGDELFYAEVMPTTYKNNRESVGRLRDVVFIFVYILINW